MLHVGPVTVGIKPGKARKAVSQVEFISLSRELHTRCREHHDVQLRCVVIQFEVASCVRLAGREERAFAQHSGCVPGSLQTVFGNCGAGIRDAPFTGGTHEAQRIKQLVQVSTATKWPSRDLDPPLPDSQALDGEAVSSPSQEVVGKAWGPCGGQW